MHRFFFPRAGILFSIRLGQVFYDYFGHHYPCNMVALAETLQRLLKLGRATMINTRTSKVRKVDLH